MIPSGSQTTNGIHFASLESGGIDMGKYLLEEDFIARVKQQDKDTFDVLCKADNLRQIVYLISIRSIDAGDQASQFRIFQIIGELFELDTIKSILSAFLGEAERKTTSMDSSSFRDSDSKIEEEPQISQSSDKIAASPLSSRNSLNWNCEQIDSNYGFNDECEKLFFVSNNVLVDFVEILRLESLSDASVQHYFNQVFTSLLNFRPEMVQSMVLEKHKISRLLAPALKLISDFEIADVIEKICFHTYNPSEKVSEEYLQQIEPQVSSLLDELLGLVTQEIDDLEMQSICKIFKSCLEKLPIHRTFEKFTNKVFEVKQIQKFLDVLITSKNSQVKTEIAVFLKTGVQIFFQENTEGKNSNKNKNKPYLLRFSNLFLFKEIICAKMCMIFKEGLKKEWLEVLVNEFRRIKENVLENTDRSRTVLTQFQQSVAIFGSERLAIIELIFEIIKLDSNLAANELIMQDVPRTIFSFLFQYEWNNLLHEQIYILIDYLVQSAITSTQINNCIMLSSSTPPNLKLLIHMVTDVEIFRHLRKLSDEETIILEHKQILLQRPNIAFVIKIAQVLQKFRQHCPEIDQYFSDTQKEKWTEFCDTFLKKKLEIQAIKLGEYDKEKEIAEMKRISDELAKNMVNQSKLSERYRKNSGKGTNLFILNPSNKKKFSTGTIGGLKQKMSAEFDDLSSKGCSSLSASRSRRKGFCSEEMSSTTLFSCLDESNTAKLIKGIENKGDSISSSQSPTSINIVRKTSPQKTGTEEKLNETIRAEKSNQMLANLDDSWEQSQKRIITVSDPKNGGGIRFDEAIKKSPSQKNEKQIQNEEEQDQLACQNQTQMSDISKIFFKRKESNHLTSTRSFGDTLFENIKNKKYSYDEPNSEPHFLLSPTILKKRARIKSQPNLSSMFDEIKFQSDLSDELPAEDLTLQIKSLHSADESFQRNHKNRANQIKSITITEFQRFKDNITENVNDNNYRINIKNPLETEKQFNVNLNPKQQENTNTSVSAKKSNETFSSTTANSIENTQDSSQSKLELSPINEIPKEPPLLLTPPTKKVNQKSQIIFEADKISKVKPFRQFSDRSGSFNKINEEENDSHSETELSASQSKSSGSGHEFTLESIDSLSPQRQLVLENAKKDQQSAQSMRSPISSFSLFGDFSVKKQLNLANNLFSALEAEEDDDKIKPFAEEEFPRQRKKRKESMFESLESTYGLYDRSSTSKGSCDMEGSNSSSSTSGGGLFQTRNNNFNSKQECGFLSEGISSSTDSQDSQVIITKEKRSSCPNEAIFLMNKSDKLTQQLRNSPISLSSIQLDNSKYKDAQNTQKPHFHQHYSFLKPKPQS